MEGELSVASAGSSRQRRTAMEGSQKAQVVHRQSEKGSKIPVVSKIPQRSHQEMLTSQTPLPQTSRSLMASPERPQGKDKSTAATCQDKEKLPHHLSIQVKPTTISREGGDKRGKATASDGAKENVAPISTQSRHGGQRGHPTSNGPKKATVRNSMSYMELKRRHHELLSEIASLEGKSREQEESHWAQVNQFTQEIEQSKETNLALREEITSYQATVKERNRQLDALQQRFEEIKFENERLAAVLESSKVDAVTGEKIAKSSEFQDIQSKLQLQLGNQEQVLDDFISTLESTLSHLQEDL